MAFDQMLHLHLLHMARVRATEQQLRDRGTGVVIGVGTIALEKAAVERELAAREVMEVIAAVAAVTGTR